MKNQTKDKEAMNKKPDKFEKDIQPDHSPQIPKRTLSDEDAEADLNSKILKITMTIMEQYPELSKYLEEMPVTIPHESNPEITKNKLNNLKAYYESLSLMLNKYKMEHPNIEQ